MISILFWYVAISLVGILALPLAYRLLPFLSDRGFSFIRPLGLLLWGYIFWFLTSLQVLQNDLGGLFFALSVLSLLSLWAGRGCWSEIWAWLQSRKRSILLIEGVFLFAFIAWTVIRAANPGIQYTEKTMELAFINSILRSETFPPRDPWLSGYAISYYYFGYILVAALAKLTGITGSIAFNLAISSWFAMTAAAAYGIVYTLLNRWFARDEADSNRGLSWGLLAPIFVLIIGNLEGFLGMLHARGLFWSQAADGSWQSRFWTWLGIADLNQPPAMPFGWMPHRDTWFPPWRASRVLTDFRLNPASGPVEIIDEFPQFSFLLGDLHPHVLSMPFVLLAVALALNLYLSRRNIISWSTEWWQWLRKAEFWLAAVVLGGLAFLNTWDFPIYVALFAGSYALLRSRQRRREGHASRWLADFIRLGLLLGIAGVLLYLPFYFGFSSQAGGILPSIIFFTPGKNLWVMFATLFIPVLIWLGYLWKQQGDGTALVTGLKFSLLVVGGLWLISFLFGLLIASLPGFGIALQNSSNPALFNIGQKMAEGGTRFLIDVQNGEVGQALPLLAESMLRRLISPGAWLTLGILIALSWGLLTAFQKSSVGRAQVRYEEQVLGSIVNVDNDRASGFALLLLLLGVGLVLLPEFFYLRDLFGTRMNTIFKFYFQAWILLAMVAAYGSAVVLRSLRSPIGWVVRAGWLLIFLAGLVYPFFMIPNVSNNFQPSYWSVDGAKYLELGAPDIKAAMDWLRQAPVGTLAEGVTESYDYGRVRYSVFSGQPAVLGWPWHEVQWGRSEQLGSRQQDMQVLYTTRDWTEAEQILQRYRISYVVVGPNEMALYNNSQTGSSLYDVKFQEMLTPVFQNGSVTIYEVPSQIWEEGQPAAIQ